MLTFTLLTLLRPSEAARLEWSEVDLENKLVSLPAERMKRRLPHVVPLSRQAAALLEEVQPYSGDRFVFPARHDRSKPSDSIACSIWSTS